MGGGERRRGREEVEGREIEKRRLAVGTPYSFPSALTERMRVEMLPLSRSHSTSPAMTSSLKLVSPCR